jgi:hypothetical protein
VDRHIAHNNVRAGEHDNRIQFRLGELKHMPQHNAGTNAQTKAFEWLPWPCCGVVWKRYCGACAVHLQLQLFGWFALVDPIEALD